MPVSDCTMDFPVLYGSPASSVRHYVTPKPLKIGAIYAVQTQGSGGYGSGCFHTPTRHVENLAQERCYSARSEGQNLVESA